MCPECNKKLVYKNYYKFKLAVECDKSCHMCASQRRRKHPNTRFRNCPKCNSIIEYKNANYRNTAESRNVLCLYCSNSKESNPMYGKSHDSETKDKIKDSNIKTMRNRTIVGRRHGVNQKSFKILDEISKNNGWKLQHDGNGGEVQILNYFVDGYDKKHNLVVEYDEPSHYRRGKLIKRDIDRMEDIVKYLNCKFYRYNEKTEVLTKYH